jgi:beta-lactamase class A
MIRGRRRFMALTATVLPALLLAAPRRLTTLSADLKRLEALNGGRLGVAVFDTGSGEHADHRGEERFPMCSTFKFLLAAAVLQRVDRGQEHPDRNVAVPAGPLLSHSPLTLPHAGGTMPVEALCHAVLNQSDNTAANLLLTSIGGPPGVTQFARSIGDTVTRLDRTEPDLNESRDQDPRDTTSPVAMAVNLQRILLGTMLTAHSREQMVQWMRGSVTGLERLRAKLPATWRAADKSGSNGSHTSNDIAVLWPPGRAPVIVTAYLTQCLGPESKREGMLAHIGELVRAAID